MPVERTLICPPRCRIGVIASEERAAVRARSPLGGKYDTPVNRESAYEILSRRTLEKGAAGPPPKQAEAEKPPFTENAAFVNVGHQAPAGHGGDHGQTGRSHRGKPDRQTDPARGAGRHSGWIAAPLE